MSAAGNKAVVRRLFEQVVSGGDYDAADELFGPTHAAHGAPPDAPRGPVVATTAWRRWRAAFPDWRATIEFQVAEGDLVVTRVTGRGTHRGALTGPRWGWIEPTDREVVVAATAVHRLAEGKIVEVWETWDFLGLLQQLGVVPTPVQPAGEG
jgi:predicted ester cyclase